MKNINSDIFQTARDCMTPAVIENLFPGGVWKKNGEYWIKNPLRNDSKPNSFSISEKGLYHDFSSDHDGDIIQLITESQNVSKLEAAKMIIEKSGAIIPETKPAKKEKVKAPAIPIPEDAKPKLETKVREKYFSDTYGKPVIIYPYRNYDKKLIMCVCRFEKPSEDGKKPEKSTVPFYYTEQGWQIGRPDTRIPFYGEHRLKDSNNHILFAEGEKCGDVKIPGYIVLSWIGGAAGIEKGAPWQWLKEHIQQTGRKVFIWPDRDRKVWDEKEKDTAVHYGQKPGDLKPFTEQPGTKAALFIQSVIPDAEILDIEGAENNENFQCPDGWDIADAASKKINLVKFIEGCPRLESNKEILLPEYSTPSEFNALPVLEAETLVSGIWENIKGKIIPDCLNQCFTEDGITETCGQILKSEIFYKSITDEFYIKEHGSLYRPDNSNVVFYAIRQIGKKLNSIKYHFNDEGQEALTKSLKKPTTQAGLKSIFTLLKTEPYLIRTTNEIDPEGLLMTPAGSRDPFTGEIKIKPGAVFTRCTAYDPQSGGVPVQFYKFLYDIFKIENPDKTAEENEQDTTDVINRLLDIIAAALTGNAPQLEKFLIFSGKGVTGKQQLLELLENIFSDYFIWMRPESLYETTSGGDTPRSDLFRIQGALIVGISEPSDQKLSASLFKTLGSGEPIPCRPHHGRTITEVRPRGLFIIAANRKPFIVHDSGVDRRIEVYEFNNNFSESNDRIFDIGRIIAESEAPAIFTDLIRRAGAWKARGGDLPHITQSETVKGWTNNYIGWSDVIGRFLEDETEKVPGAVESVKEIYDRFTDWADKHGENRMSGRALGEALSERGIKKIKQNSGWKFTGIRLVFK